MGCNPILKWLHCDQWDCATSVIAALTQTGSDPWCKRALKDLWGKIHQATAMSQRGGSNTFLRFIHVFIFFNVCAKIYTLSMTTQMQMYRMGLEPSSLLERIYIQRLRRRRDIAAISLWNQLHTFCPVLLHPVFATVTKLPVTGELLCNIFGSDVAAMMQTRRWM